jgi:hypothetical protein
MAGKEHHPEYGKQPGNQEPNTPDVNESEQRRRDSSHAGRHHAEQRHSPGETHQQHGGGSHSESGQDHAATSQGEHRQQHQAHQPHRQPGGSDGHHPEWGKEPGNQQPNTPNVRESDRRKK